MGKAVQYPGSFAELCHCPSVVFLIKEESCLLSVLYIHIIAHAVLHNLYLCIKRLADKSLTALHSFLLADFRVTALIDAPDVDAVFLHQFF